MYIANVYETKQLKSIYNSYIIISRVLPRAQKRGLISLCHALILQRVLIINYFSHMMDLHFGVSHPTHAEILLGVRLHGS